MAARNLSIAVAGRSESRGSIPRVLTASILVAVAVGMMVVGRDQAGIVLTCLLAGLAAIGIFSLLAVAAGVLQLPGDAADWSIPNNALEYSDDGVLVADARGRVLYANATFRALAGTAGLQVGLIYLRPIDRVLAGGAGVAEAVYRLRNAVAGGKHLQEEVQITGVRGEPPRWLRLQARPLLPAAGADSPAASLWTVTDITCERHLNTSQELPRPLPPRPTAAAPGADVADAADAPFMRFFNNTPMAIATVDRSGRVARSNALFAHLFRSTPGGEATPGQSDAICGVVAERDRAALDAALAQAAAGHSDIAPIDAALAGGAERWARFYVTPIEEAERDAETAIVYAIETTAQRVLQRQFDQAQKMESVGKLAGGIAHDFNNVLSSIMMATDFLLTAHKPSDPSFQDIMQIKQDANRAAGLVRHLLAFSRRQTLHPQVLDLGETLSELSVLLGRLIGERVLLDLIPGRDLWAVKADQSQFEQVIVNLAVNARDAMPEGGKLTLRTANVTADETRKLALKDMPAADYVLVEVTDSGTGIPPDIIDRIFEPFFSTKEVGKGTGLGLSTVYGIVKQTGGFVYPESVIGKGTTFRIFLPRHIPTAAEVAAATDQAASPRPDKAARPVDDTGQGTVLLVEDEEGLRGLNARGLRSRGYTVLQAANGLEALEAFDACDGKIDLVVSDVVMPEMDGPTLLSRLRDRDPSIKVIFVSGYAEEAFEKHLPDGEPYGFLAKPFTLKQLVSKVKETAGK